MNAVIQGCIAALGFLEDGVYYKEPDCYETIRDIIRYLRNDSEDLTARKSCGERNIVENDLIPIMKMDYEDEKMFDIVLRLMVNLVQPVSMTLSGKPPEDRESFRLSWSLEENLRKTKSGFTDVRFFEILKQKLEHFFIETEKDDRTEENRLVMERIIALLRYIFAVPSSPGDERRTKLENNSNDLVTLAFLKSGIQEILIKLASKSGERDFHISILQIVSQMVREHNPSDIVAAVYGRNEEEKRKAEEELKATVESEMNRAASLKRKILSSRHSRFAGSYVVKGMAAVNKENELVVHRVVKDAKSLNFIDERKTKQRIAKNRRPFEGSEAKHVSSLETRLSMKDFIEKFMEQAFNPLMKTCKDLVFNNRGGHKNVDMHYFKVMRFFTEYCRLARLSSKLVNNCLGVEAFHHVQIQLDEALQNAATQRKEAKYFGMKAQCALSAYKELIVYLQHMMDNGTGDEKEEAKNTCFHIVSMEEYRDLALQIIRKFMPGALSKTFLRELVLATHYYFRILERSVKQGSLRMVKKRVKRRKPKKSGKSGGPSDKKPDDHEVDKYDDDVIDDIWAMISNELSDVCTGYLEPSDDQVPLNALLDVPDEDHQRFAMLRIQRALREQRVRDAVAIYRGAREIWNTDNIFGSDDMEPEEEFCEIREIYFADLQEVAKVLLTAETASNERYNNFGNESEGSDDSEDDEPRYDVKEFAFEFDEYVGKFARIEVLKWYVFLLREFATNTVELNRALVKMLHRVAFDLKMPSRLYQLSLLMVFCKVNDHLGTLTKEEKKKNSLYELYNFGFHLLRKLFKHFEELGDKLAPELLFWKGAKECYEIENGYGSYQSKSDETTWTEELEDEVRALYAEYRDMDERPEGIDVLDFIEHNLSRARTRRQIQRKMKEFALDTLGAKVNKGSAQDRLFPVIDVKRLIERFEERDTAEEEDLVNYLKESLASDGKGEFTRQKNIKQLNYLGVAYEKKRKVRQSKHALPWEDDLEAQLSELVQKHKELDEEGDSIQENVVDYVRKSLAGKKTRSQVERRLVALGVIEPPPKVAKSGVRKPTEKKKKDGFVVNSDEEEESGSEKESEDEEGSISGDSGAEDDEETTNKRVNPLVDSDDEAGDMGKRLSDKEMTESPRKANTFADQIDRIINGSDSDDSREPSVSKDSPVKDTTPTSPLPKNTKRNIIESDDEDDSPVMKTPLRENSINSPKISSINRGKKIVVSDDEEDQIPVESTSPTENLPVTKKRKRISSSDEEKSPTPEKRHTPFDDASPVKPKKKSSRVILDSDDDES